MDLSPRWRVAATMWGFAEATLFFVVPDMLITGLALRGLRRGFEATAFALAGALVGGVLMWHWGAHDLAAARAALDYLPAIGPDLMDRVATELRTTGIVSICIGPFVGVPYKIYAIEAAQAGAGLATFLLVSIPARAPRFILLACVAAYGARWGKRYVSERTLIAIWLATWIINYAIYWSVMPS